MLRLLLLLFSAFAVFAPAAARFSIGALGQTAATVERHENRLVEHFLQVLLRQRRALDVALGVYVLGQLTRLRLRHRLVIVLVELNQHFDVIAQVALRADEHDGRVPTVLTQLRQPLVANVVE